MADTAIPDDDAAAPTKKSSKMMLVSAVLAVVLGAGSFGAVYLGLVPLPFGAEEPAMAEAPSDLDSAATTESGDAVSGGVVLHDTDHQAPTLAEADFIPVQPFVVSLGPGANADHLRVTVQIEVEAERRQEVEGTLPRIVDVLNTYLRAVDERDFEVPRAMLRLKAQMVRRVQLVTPPGAVRNVLIQDFVLN